MCFLFVLLIFFYPSLYLLLSELRDSRLKKSASVLKGAMPTINIPKIGSRFVSFETFIFDLGLYLTELNS